MVKYDVTDEAIINASPKVVYKSVIDEMDGKTSWWMPHRSLELREGDSYGQVGALLDSTVRSRFTTQFTTKTVEVKANEMIRVEYVEGALRGEGLWKFPSQKGKTKISYRWQTKPAGWFLRIIGPFLPVRKSHSKVMKAGFENLNNFLSEKSKK